MSSCKIYMDNHRRTLSPGAPISGRLECYFKDRKTVRGIKVRLQCKEHNSWTQSETYIDRLDNNKVKTRNVHYSGDNYIIRVDYILLGSDSGDFEVDRGKHVYPFSFKLPHNIPSTYDGPYGYISYRLKGIVDRPFKFDYEDSCYFKVSAPIDFNKMPRGLQRPAKYSDEKTVCDWCCQGGSIVMEVELPKTAFTLGETINIKVDVCNMSNTNVEQLNIILTKKIKYRVTSPPNSRENKDEMAFLHKHGVGAHGQFLYNIPFTISQFSFIPNFAQCTLFEVSYLLRISCQMPSCTFDLDIDIWDIEMGNIPWSERNENDLPPSYQPPLPGPSTSRGVSPPPPFNKLPSAPPLAPSAPVDSTRPSAPSKEDLALPSIPSTEDLPPSYNEAFDISSPRNKKT